MRALAVLLVLLLIAPMGAAQAALPSYLIRVSDIDAPAEPMPGTDFTATVDLEFACITRGQAVGDEPEIGLQIVPPVGFDYTLDFDPAYTGTPCVDWMSYEYEATIHGSSRGVPWAYDWQPWHVIAHANSTSYPPRDAPRFEAQFSVATMAFGAVTIEPAAQSPRVETDPVLRFEVEHTVNGDVGFDVEIFDAPAPFKVLEVGTAPRGPGVHVIDVVLDTDVQQWGDGPITLRLTPHVLGHPIQGAETTHVTMHLDNDDATFLATPGISPAWLLVGLVGMILRRR